MSTSFATEQVRLVNRREAIRRISILLGGVALVGGDRLLAAYEKAALPLAGTVGEFSIADIAFLDEVAETILPQTKTPGAKAAKTGAFMALMVTDSYYPNEQNVFREGMRKVDAATRTANKVSFMVATPQQRLAVLTVLDHEQKRVMDAREAVERKRKGLAPLPADRTKASEPAVSAADANPDAPAHYFRMMKQLALLGYFTSEIGCTKAQRYIETPSRFDPCVPYAPGEPAWATHA
ncbi:MAG: gluconate 2-dehydrogenase subunit 3 family protein [Rudaea sp.]